MPDLHGISYLGHIFLCLICNGITFSSVCANEMGYLSPIANLPIVAPLKEKHI